MSDELWEKLTQRITHDGYYGVKTTKVYCTFGCPSRLPNRANVIFFAQRREAELVGYHPCKRCLNSNKFDPVELSIERIEATEGPVTLKELCALTALSSAQLRRRFEKQTGLSPSQYGLEVRRRKYRAEIANRTSVTEAALEAGYGSTGHASEDSNLALGMTPTEFKSGAPGLVIEWASAQTLMGWILVARTHRGICSVEIDESLERLKMSLHSHFSQARLVEEPEYLKSDLKAILDSLERPKDLSHLDLDLQGTLFQKRVWTALRKIPVGKTKSYGELASDLGQPNAYRAVARACATNKIAVAVPCHRVLGKSGKLTGYRWGLEVKRKLLEIEGLEPG